MWATVWDETCSVARCLESAAIDTFGLFASSLRQLFSFYSTDQLNVFGKQIDEQLNFWP